MPFWEGPCVETSEELMLQATDTKVKTFSTKEECSVSKTHLTLVPNTNLYLVVISITLAPTECPKISKWITEYVSKESHGLSECFDVAYVPIPCTVSRSALPLYSSFVHLIVLEIVFFF